MSEPHPALGNSCPTCGMDAEGMAIELAALREQVFEMQENKTLLEEDIGKKRAQIKRMQRVRGQRLRNHKLYGDAVVVLEFWKSICMPTAKEPLSDDRVENVIARLQGGFTVAALKDCAWGYSKRPFVGVQGKRSSQGRPDERYVDAELIYRTPRHVQTGLHMAEAERKLASLLPEPTESPSNGPKPSNGTRTLGRLGVAAVTYAERSVHVFPCRPGTKVPATPHGFLDAHADIERIVNYWLRNPMANVTLRCGRQSDLIVLDVDEGKGGPESLFELEQEHGTLPKTATVKTPRGGSHYYFRHPGEDIVNTQGFPLPGLDIRGDGGYALAPPSIVDGKHYETDEKTAPVEMPGWLVRLLLERQEEKKIGRSAQEWGVLLQAEHAEGGRNATMASFVGGLLSKMGEEYEWILGLALSWNQTNMKPPMPPREVEGVVKHVITTRRRKSK